MSLSDTCNALVHVLEVLEPFLPLVSCHMVNFLSHDLWSALIPLEIREEVEKLGVDDAYDYIRENDPEKENLPSALKQYLQNAKKVSSLANLKMEDFWSMLENEGYKAEKADPQLTMFMSAKKAHEVQLLSKVTASLALITDVGCIIDLGGGKGYLGSTLAYHYGLRVLSIDCAQVNTHGAVKLANNLKKWWDVMQDHSSPEGLQGVEKLYKQATSFISPETDLREFVQENFQADKNVVNLQNLCLVGLHACGDLTPSCIRLFCANSDIKALCIVGCCYNLLSEDFEEESEKEAFPMSLFLKERGVKLGRNARMLAAQSIERITEYDKPPPASLWFRALFQMLLIERNQSSHSRVGRVKASVQDFPEYVSKALDKLKLPQATAEEIRGIQMKYQKRETLHNIFFMLRVALAPVIERLILLDRLLYLQEQGTEHAYLVLLFDSVISPRCCGIIAYKK